MDHLSELRESCCKGRHTSRRNSRHWGTSF